MEGLLFAFIKKGYSVSFSNDVQQETVTVTISRDSRKVLIPFESMKLTYEAFEGNVEKALLAILQKF